MTVLSFNASADGEVAAENQFNDPPPPGSHYALLNVSLAYNGQPGEDSSYFFGTISILGTGNVPHGNTDQVCVAPDALERTKEVFAGGTITGNLCYALPESEEGFVAFASGGFSGDKVYFSLA